MTAFVAILLPVTIALGFWQLERAAQKERLELDYLASQAGLPEDLANLDLSAPLQRLRLEGEYEPQHFLIDNQTRAGRVGYRVVTPFRVADGRRFLIDRGWTEAPPNRADLPEVATPVGKQRIIGTLWHDQGMTPLWGDDPWEQGWPKRIQRLDVDRAAVVVEQAVAVEVRLEGGQPGSLVATPSTPVISAGTHYGYAVQWFGLAAALAVLFVFFGVRQGRIRGAVDDDSQQ